MSAWNFFAELKRRNVYKVAIAYAIVAVGIAQGSTEHGCDVFAERVRTIAFPRK